MTASLFGATMVEGAEVCGAAGALLTAGAGAAAGTGISSEPELFSMTIERPPTTTAEIPTATLVVSHERAPPPTVSGTALRAAVTTALSRREEGISEAASGFSIICRLFCCS